MEHWEHLYNARESQQEEYDELYNERYDELVGYFDTIEGIAELFTEIWDRRIAKGEIIEVIPDDNDEVWDMSLEEVCEYIKSNNYEKQVIDNLEHYLDSFCEEYAENN